MAVFEYILFIYRSLFLYISPHFVPVLRVHMHTGRFDVFLCAKAG